MTSKIKVTNSIIRVLSNGIAEQKFSIIYYPFWGTLYVVLSFERKFILFDYKDFQRCSYFVSGNCGEAGLAGTAYESFKWTSADRPRKTKSCFGNHKLAKGNSHAHREKRCPSEVRCSFWCFVIIFFPEHMIIPCFQSGRW